MNNLGDIIDKIQLKNDKEEECFKEYLLNPSKDYYPTWLLDNNKEEDGLYFEFGVFIDGTLNN